MSRVEDLYNEVAGSMGVEKVAEVVAFINLFRPSAETIVVRTLMGGFIADISDIRMLLSAAATGGADAYRCALLEVAPELVDKVDAYLKEHPLEE